MTKLYFRHREFSGVSWDICEMLEGDDFRASLVFNDSWYFFIYQFFCKDCIGSETSAAVQTHLYDLVSVLYRDFESLVGGDASKEKYYLAIIAELVEICEYSSAFPVCLWSYGDETNREFVDEWLAPMPSPEQMAHVLKLPHMTRHERERISYRHGDPKISLKRYRNAQADFNRRRKLAAKNEQRSLPGSLKSQNSNEV